MASSSSPSIRREPTLTLSPATSSLTQNTESTGRPRPVGQDEGIGCDVRASHDRALSAFVRKPPIETVAFGWGVNEDGQLGLMETGSVNEKGENGKQPFVLSPKVVEGLLGTKFRGREGSRSPIVAGSRNTMVVTADGQVYSWGWNDRATLGQGHQNPVTKPSRVVGLQGVHIVQVALGGWHALALDKDGQCWAWGGNEYNQCDSVGGGRDLTVPSRCLTNVRVMQVEAGGMHSVALSDTGHIWQWGEPWGEFEMTVHREPRRLEVGVGHGADRGNDTVIKVACGAFHNLALTSSGTVFSWGINDYGQLGNGTTCNSKVPILVEGLHDVSIRDVACGGWHSVAISEEGEVYVWGRGEYGRLGLGDKSGASKLRPTKVEGLEGHRVAEASCGGTHTMVVTDEGRIFVWGRGSFGRLGTGNEQNHFGPVEVCLPGGPDRWWIIAAAAGGRHSMCLAVPDNGDIGDRFLGEAWEGGSVDLGRPSATADVSRGPSRASTPMSVVANTPHTSSRQWSGSQDVGEAPPMDEDADDEEEESEPNDELDGDSDFVEEETDAVGSQRNPSYMDMIKSLHVEDINDGVDGSRAPGGVEP